MASETERRDEETRKRREQDTKASTQPKRDDRHERR
jgi:hypothetical protein